MKTKAFTLTELLVVIAVIAVLATLLFPALKGATENSKSTQCVANLRGIGAAALNYAAENDGRLPPIAKAYNWNAANATKWWTTFLVNTGSAGVVDVRKVWRCPCVADQDFTTVDAITYSSYTPLKPVISFVTASSPEGSYKLVQIEKPSATWMFGDGGTPVGTNDANQPPKQYKTAGAIDRWPKNWGSTARPAFRHGGGTRANYVACDGHVDSLSWDKFTSVDCGPFGYYDKSSGNAAF